MVVSRAVPPRSAAAARQALRRQPDIDRFRAQHLALAETQVMTPEGAQNVTVDAQESPLAWLARRAGHGGRPMIAPHQYQAGERLRADFTVAHLMPRTTSNWDNPIVSGRRRTGAMHATDSMIAARQRVRHALDAVGPEFSGLLLDVCCFLKGLGDVERERVWPVRSAKIVLQLALDRLARHYGYAGETSGRAQGRLRAWLETESSGRDAGAPDERRALLAQKRHIREP
jgi:hypothetical protein